MFPIYIPFGQPLIKLNFSMKQIIKRLFISFWDAFDFISIFSIPFNVLMWNIRKRNNHQRKGQKRTFQNHLSKRSKVLDWRKKTLKFYTKQKSIGQQFIRIIRFIVPKVASRNAILLLKWGLTMRIWEVISAQFTTGAIGRVLIVIVVILHIQRLVHINR